MDGSRPSALQEYLEVEGIDGYCIDDDATDSDQRYVSGFTAPDPYQTVVTGDGVHLLVSGLEYGRADADANADSVTRRAAYDYQNLAAEYGRYGAKIRALEAFRRPRRRVGRGPAKLSDGNRRRPPGARAHRDGRTGRNRRGIRATKTEWEIDRIATTQRANEAAMATAEELIAEADVDDGVLVHDGDPSRASASKRRSRSPPPARLWARRDHRRLRCRRADPTTGAAARPC